MNKNVYFNRYVHCDDLVNPDHAYKVLLDEDLYYKTANELYAVQRFMEV